MSLRPALPVADDNDLILDFYCFLIARVGYQMFIADGGADAGFDYPSLARKLGADDVVSKPVSTEKLIRMVREAPGGSNNPWHAEAGA